MCAQKSNRSSGPGKSSQPDACSSALSEAFQGLIHPTRELERRMLQQLALDTSLCPHWWSVQRLLAPNGAAQPPTFQIAFRLSDGKLFEQVAHLSVDGQMVYQHPWPSAPPSSALIASKSTKRSRATRTRAVSTASGRKCAPTVTAISNSHLK
jgi:hypothetical protein